MKLSNLSKVVGVGAIALSTAILPLNMPASAQTDTGTTGTTGTTGVEREGVAYQETENDFDWGWLGLLGLLGLAGLAGKKRSEPTAYRDPNTVGTTGYRE